MARFGLGRSSRFFRRSTSARSSTSSSTTPTITAVTTTAHHDPPPSSPPKTQPTLPPAPSPPFNRTADAAPPRKRSSSLLRRRDRASSDRGRQTEPVRGSNSPPTTTTSTTKPPPTIDEVREAVAYADEPSPTSPRTSPRLARAQEASPSPRRSGSVTLAPKRNASDSTSRSPDYYKADHTPVQEVLVPAKDSFPSPPPPVVVTLEEPTPVPAEGFEKRQDSHVHHGHHPADLPPSPISPLPPVAPIARVADTAADHTSIQPNRPDTPPPTAPENTSRSRQHPGDGDDAKIAQKVIDIPDKSSDVDARPGSSTLSPAHAFTSYCGEVSTMATVQLRKIWVRRPGASATLVQVREDDLVDDVRDMILRKYANSLGKSIDAPDVTLRIAQRSDHNGPKSERLLGPEESMCRTIDSYYPGGQKVDEALIIDVPAKRTPRPSPKHYANAAYHYIDDYRPLESGTDYFPQMPVMVPTTIPQTAGSHDSRTAQGQPAIAVPQEHHRSISVLNTGQLPPLPSPGAGRRHGTHRPRIGRQHTSSPTILAHPQNAGMVSSAHPPITLNPNHQFPHRGAARARLEPSTADGSAHVNGAPAAPPLPTPPAPEAPPTNANGSSPATPPGSTSLHPHRSARPKKTRKVTPDKPGAKSRHSRNGSNTPSNNVSLVSSMLDASVPPIKILIVEDNNINLRVLEGLMKRLKVRWQTAMNGQIAVDSWRKGGFHLVLMDIQMPVMNGLQATKEIRRLERVNGIGVFSSSSPSSPVERKANASSTDLPTDGNDAEAEDKVKDPEADKLNTNDGSLFKSPVIIVALTASSLQSDRHEALAAGCNDFLTKPVNFVWLERKVKEWGCMQALIDFDGWRKWKDYAAIEEAGKTEEQRQAEAEADAKAKVKMEKLAKLQEKQRLKAEEDERRKKRTSLDSNGASGAQNGAA